MRSIRAFIASHTSLLSLPAAALCAILLSACAKPIEKGEPGAFDRARIEHVIVIYLENWSFDGLYSRFPGANGFAFGTPVPQLDADGVPLTAMDMPYDSAGRPFTSTRWSGTMPVIFYNLGALDGGANPYTDSSKTADVTHRFYHHQRQINGGKNDRFLFWSDLDPTKPSGRQNMNSLTLSGADASNFPVGKLAREYAMCDNCFQSAYGGSFLNHQWLVAARMPVYYNALANETAKSRISDPNSPIPSKWDARLAATPTPENRADYYAINTVQPPFPPSGQGLVLPPQRHPTIGDRLDAAGRSWKWYAQEWNEVPKTMNGPERAFQYHHQPFNYYAAFDPSTPAGAANRAKHLADLEDFYADLGRGSLPNMSFIKLTNDFNEHPYDAAILEGDRIVAGMVRKIMADTAVWNNCAIIITYDEFGGRWDHVPPPPSPDGFGPGSRIPMIIVSPFTRGRGVDHTQYETVSILAFIENLWGIAPLTDRDRNANNLMNAFRR